MLKWSSPFLFFSTTVRGTKDNLVLLFLKKDGVLGMIITDQKIFVLFLEI
eukprot:m.96952 g.96952  ORF g.96952 m.96952 type:complete len:50 (-) comp8977_c0_seq3:8-157(-)